MCCARVICCGSTQMEYKEALNTRCHMAAGILLTMQLRDDCLDADCRYMNIRYVVLEKSRSQNFYERDVS